MQTWNIPSFVENSVRPSFQNSQCTVPEFADHSFHAFHNYASSLGFSFRHTCRLGQNCFALLVLFNWQTISWSPTCLGFSGIRRIRFGIRTELACQREREREMSGIFPSFEFLFAGITVFHAPVFRPGISVRNCVIRCICFRFPDQSHLAPPTQSRKPNTTSSATQPFRPFCCCCLFASSSCRVTFRVQVCVNLAPLI